MATVKLAAQLPKPDSGMNGLEAISDALIERPNDPHILVILVDCAKTEIDHNGGSKTPTAQVLQVEVLVNRDAMEAQRMLVDARRSRVARDRTPTGGLFGDPIANTSEVLASIERGEANAGQILGAAEVNMDARDVVDRIEQHVADQMERALEADRLSREAGVPVDRD